MCYNMSADMNRMQIVLSSEDMRRISEVEDGYRVDIHGKNRWEAKTLIRNIINLVNHPFVLDVIHGYNHGVVLKVMINSEDINPRIVCRKTSNYNMGETFLTVA